jgi:hypothetical protein
MSSKYFKIDLAVSLSLLLVHQFLLHIHFVGKGNAKELVGSNHKYINRQILFPLINTLKDPKWKLIKEKNIYPLPSFKPHSLRVSTDLANSATLSL